MLVGNSYISKMSFFEQMMKLHQPAFKPSVEKEREAAYNEEETAPNQDHSKCLPYEQPRQMLKDLSLKSSLSLKLEDLSEDEADDNIFREPSILPMNRAARHRLLHHLLPKKEQLVREVIAKKRQFEMKQVSLRSNRKEAEQESRAREESCRLRQSEYQSNKSVKLGQSRNEQIKSSSVKGYSTGKSRPRLNLGESDYSASLQAQLLASPVAQDSFNKEVMLKLLSILEKDRQNPPIAESTVLQPAVWHKEVPVIINNIMKTPMESMSRDLIEREMKIRLMENNRFQKQSSKYSHQKGTSPRIECRREVYNQEVVLTERTRSRPSMSGFEGTSSCQKPSSRKEGAGRSPAARQTDQMEKQNALKNSESNRKPSDQEEEGRGIKIALEEYNENNSNQNSRIRATLQKSDLKRDFRKNQTTKETRTEEQAFQRISEPVLAKKVQQPVQEGAPRQVRAAVKLEIPLDNQSETQGMSLAEAFKRKVGRLKSEQKRTQKVTDKSLKKADGLQSFPSQMAITITDKFTEYNSEFDYSAPVTGKNINISIEGPQSKRSLTSAPPSKPTSMRKRGKEEERTSSKKSSEPCKDLIDRLIYGERAKVSKEDMYALTRKNYNNLPEVVAKRKEEEKKKTELERKNKALEYQKAIRSAKSRTKS